MAQVARAQTEAAGGPAVAAAPRRAVPRHGRARGGGRGHRRGPRGPRRRGGRSTRAPCRTATAIIRNAEAEVRVCLRSRSAHASPGADPAQGRRGLQRDRAAGRLQDARGRRRARVRPVDDPQRARDARGAGAARAPAHLRGPRADRRRLPLLRRPPAARAAGPHATALDLQLVRREVDEAMRVTSETLAQVTNLLAIVSAPPIDTATIRHVEVLLLQPQVLMVVVITSTGGVTKRVFTFDAPVDPGLAAGRASTSTSGSSGIGLGARTLRSQLQRPGARAAASAAFLEALAPAFTELAATAEDTLYVDGTARLLAEHRFQDLSQINELMAMLERRALLLGVLRAALSERDVLVRIGSENEAPALRSLALVAAGYGLPQRNLGTVSVIGPVRMDYAERDQLGARGGAPSCRASSRRSTSHERHDAARSLRGARRRARRRRDGDQEGVPQARARAAPRRQRARPRRRGEVQGGRRGLRDPLRPRAPRDLRPLRPRGPAQRRHGPGLQRLRLDQRPLRRVLRRDGIRRRRRGAPRPARRAATSRSTRRDHARAGGRRRASSS